VPIGFETQNIVKFYWVLFYFDKKMPRRKGECFDNSVEALKGAFNNFMPLRRETVSTGLGEKDNFVEYITS
jgi:hypothetical protein